MEDAVRPRIASPGWLVRTRLVRAAAAPSAMRVCARCCGGGAERREDGRGKNARTGALRACQQRQGDPSTFKPPFFLLDVVANLF